MFKIGEFSKLGQVSVRMLRYYDETGLLRPAETDSFTGYRLYTAGQLLRLNRILFLRDAGFGIAEMPQLLDNWNDELLARRFAQKREEVRRAIRAQEERLEKLSLPPQGGPALRCDIGIKSVPSSLALCCRRVIPDYWHEGALWKEIYAYAQKTSASLTGETFSIYHDTDYREKDVDVELCAPATKIGAEEGDFCYRHTEAVPQMAFTMVQGPFQRIGKAFQSFAGWLAAHPRWQMGLTSRQIVHRGPWDESDPAQYLTEIQIPLENA